MPRYVDHEVRRQEIMEAAVSVVADSGLRGLSFRSVAERLGGSTTVVTHYYPTIKDLVDDFAVSVVDWVDGDLQAFEAGAEDPYARLMALLEWLLPLTENGRREDRARISLLADELSGNQHRRFFESWEQRVRLYLREHVAPLVPADEIGPTVEFLRVLTNGISLAVSQHPTKWPRRRQLAVVRLAVASRGVGPELPVDAA